MHEIKGDDKYLHEVSYGKYGSRFLQSGPINKVILCADHEASTQSYDDYAVRFCRRVKANVVQSGASIFIENPKPSHLGRFAMVTVWRFCATVQGKGIRALGAYERTMRNGIFNGSNETIPLMIARNPLQMPDGSESNIGIAPFRTWMGHWRVWFFAIGGLCFFLKLDPQPFPTEFRDFLANEVDPVKINGLPIIEASQSNIIKNAMTPSLSVKVKY